MNSYQNTQSNYSNSCDFIKINEFIDTDYHNPSLTITNHKYNEYKQTINDQKKIKDNQIIDMEIKQTELMKRNKELENNINQLSSLMNQKNPIKSRQQNSFLSKTIISKNNRNNRDNINHCKNNKTLYQVSSNSSVKPINITNQQTLKTKRINNHPESGFQSYHSIIPMKHSKKEIRSTFTYQQSKEEKDFLSQSIIIEGTYTEKNNDLNHNNNQNQKHNKMKDELNRTIDLLTQKINQLNEELQLDKLEGKYNSIIQYELDKWIQRNTIISYYSTDNIQQIKDKNLYFHKEYIQEIKDISNQCIKEVELLNQKCIRKVKTQTGQIAQLQQLNNSIKLRLQKTTDIIGKKI